MTLDELIAADAKKTAASIPPLNDRQLEVVRRAFAAVREDMREAS